MLVYIYGILHKYYILLSNPQYILSFKNNEHFVNTDSIYFQ
jgi:hypothetical protein